MSLSQDLLNYIGSDWIKSSTIEDYARTLGFKSSTAGRKCRLLTQEGKLERKIMNKQVWYRRAERKPYEIKPCGAVDSEVMYKLFS